MKIKFIDGVAGYRGAMVICDEGHWICGQYRKRMFYKAKEPEDELVVVKQRSFWFTLLVLFHELAHCLNRKLFKGRRIHKINDLIDKHLIRKVDKQK